MCVRIAHRGADTIAQPRSPSTSPTALPTTACALVDVPHPPTLHPSRLTWFVCPLLHLHVLSLTHSLTHPPTLRTRSLTRPINSLTHSIDSPPHSTTHSSIVSPPLQLVAQAVRIEGERAGLYFMPHTERRVQDVVLGVAVLVPQQRGALYNSLDINRAFRETADAFLAGRCSSSNTSSSSNNNNNSVTGGRGLLAKTASSSSAGLILPVVYELLRDLQTASWVVPVDGCEGRQVTGRRND
jgi:hypothetical protein